MSNACTPISVGMAILVSEILLPQKQPNFPFQPWTIYSPWSSKNVIDWNWLKKFMQVGIDVKCMHTNFGGCTFSGFGDIATFKNGQISLSDHGLLTIVHGHQKIQLIRISSKKSCKYNLMSNACTPILVDEASLVSEILLPSKMAKFPFLTMDYRPWTIVHGHQKIQSIRIGSKKSCK